MMQEAPPVLLADRFPALLASLLSVLSSLSQEEWKHPTAAAGWTVHDIALHLFGDDINILSGKRDHEKGPGGSFSTWDELVIWLNEQNNRWVTATRRLSPRLICDLLQFTGEQVSDYFLTLDPDTPGGVVSWAGPDPAPTWLGLAREFTERWHHQQHIREAVGRPLLVDPYYLAPVLATFVHALPYVYRNMEAPDETSVTLIIAGDSGGVWSIVCVQDKWCLFAGKPLQSHAEVILPEDIAWRLFTKGLAKEAAREQAIFQGDRVLGGTNA